MKKLKHSKYKNTGLLFEALTKQITEDVLNNKDSAALPILKKFFRNTELNKEYQLYQEIATASCKKESTAQQLVEAIIEKRRKLNDRKLKAEKYELVKAIKESYDIDKLLTNKITSYKKLASVYKLFEFNVYDNPKDILLTKESLVESLVATEKSSSVLNETELFTDFIQLDKGTRNLTYSLLVEKFNSKYANVLNDTQKMLLRSYATSNTKDLTECIEKTATDIKQQLKKLIPTVTEKVTKIKLKEVYSLLDTVSQSKNTDYKVNLLMQYSQLLHEIKIAA